MLFANASPAAGVWLLNDNNELLVVIRKFDPGKGRMHAPGGFADGAETAFDCITRELQEELGLTPTMYTPLELFDEGVDLYDYQGESLPVLVTFFTARLINNPIVTSGDDVADVKFMRLQDVNPNDIYLPTPRQTFIKLRDQML